MKRKFSLFLGLFLFVAFSAQAAIAMDIATFEKITNNTIKQVLSGDPGDIDALIADQEKLIAIGIKGAQDYAKEAPEYAKFMNLVIDNADKMKAMTLDEIEPAWHDGEFITASGIDFEAIDHFSKALSHMDTVLHPATAIIALREYKSFKDPDLLEQVKDELSEVLEHLDHLK